MRFACLLLATVLSTTTCRPDDLDPPADGDADGDADIDGGEDSGLVFGAVEPIFVYPPNDANPAARLLDLVDGAEATIDLAAYVFDHEGLVLALERAAARGVTIRVVGDSELALDDRSRWAFDRLEAAGAALTLQRDRDFSAHNKYLIVDREVVWMGSTNFSDNGLRRNNNAALIIEGSAVAEDFTRDFEQMHDGRFGTSKTADGQSAFVVDGIQLRTSFAPQDRPHEELIELCDGAAQNIFFMIYIFTLDDMEAALIRAVRRGVTVRGIIDEEIAADPDGAALVARLRAGGVEIGGDVNRQGVWHHKVLIIDPQGDNPTVAAGSGNWTWSLGHGNDDSYVIVQDRTVARAFLQEYQAWVP